MKWAGYILMFLLVVYIVALGMWSYLIELFSNDDEEADQSSR
jgi:hypothetical protein